MNVRRIRFGSVALTGVVALGLVAAGPVVAASRTAQERATPASASVQGRYIVTLRGLAPAAVSRAAHGETIPSAAAAAAARTAESARVAQVDRTIASVSARYGIRPRDTYHYALQGFAARLSAVQLAGLRANPDILSITAVRPVYLADDDAPTGVERVGASPPPDGPALPAKLSQVNVAVLDTGIRYIPTSPADPAGDTKLNVAGGIDCSNDAHHGETTPAAWKDVDSGEGHGTHVSGTLAAEKTATGSDADIVGVAPGVHLYAVRIFSRSNGSITGDTSTVACGVDWVASTRSDDPPAGIPPIDVANMSIQGPIAGGDGPSCPATASGADAEHLAICTATAMGATFVVAAGNNARTAALTVPADYDSVITVSAMSDYDGKSGALASSDGCGSPDDSFASYSNYGSPVDLIAPGTCIESLSTSAGHTHELSGTSMATPHVSGAAARYVALLLQDHTRAEINADVVRDGLRAAANFDWTTSSDPDGDPDRLLDVGNLEAATKAVNAWAFPALITSGAPSGGGTTVDSTISVELQRTGLYAGHVAITADATMNGDPVGGVTLTPGSATMSGLDSAGVSTTVHVSVAANAPDGDILVTVHATPTGSGSSVVSGSTASVTVRVDHHKPTINSFTASLVDKVQVGDAQPVTLNWSGSDIGTGIARYEIQRRVGDSGWTSFSLSPQDATSALRLVALKADYQFRVRAIDGAGNTSDWAMLTVRLGVRDSGNAAISYSSDQSWITRNKAKAFGGSFRRSTTPGAFAAVAFTGRGIAWVAPVAPGRGTAKVYLDGTDSAHLVATISLSAPKQKDRMIVWASGALAPGSHTLVIKVVSGTVDLDAILLVKG